jgi:hypothetical protein
VNYLIRRFEDETNPEFDQVLGTARDFRDQLLEEED